MRQSSHPAHIGGQVDTSSSFIPFCAYKSNLVISENPLWLPNISYPLCSSFKPTILEGQLCYKIELDAPADQGKVNEMMILLDYNEDRSLTSPFKTHHMSFSSNITTMNLDPAGNYQQDKAKIKIDTLSNYVGFGGGSYKMISVKRMTGTPDFLGMSHEERKCDIERFQDCRTRMLLEACDCVPGQLEEYFGTHKQTYGKLANLKRCDPRGRDCFESKSQDMFNCSVSCEGVHADVQHEENKVNLMTEENHEMSSEKQNGAGNFENLLRMVKEYKTFKKSLVTSFDFDPSALQAHFGEAISLIYK